MMANYELLFSRELLEEDCEEAVQFSNSLNQLDL
jgi:hypothetical protein